MRFNHRIALSIGLIALLPVAVAMKDSRTAPRKLCDVARDWAAANSPPTSLREFDGLPYTFRKYVYGRLGPEVRIAIWREKLEAYFQLDSGLDARQMSLLREVIAKLPSLVTDPT